MDEAMRPFFLGVDTPISCPLRGSSAGFAKPGILPSGGSPSLSWGWCQPGGHALAGTLLPPLCGIFFCLCWNCCCCCPPCRLEGLISAPGFGSSSGHPPPPPSPSSAAQTSRILQMVLLNISFGCNSSICLPLS